MKKFWDVIDEEEMEDEVDIATQVDIDVKLFVEKLQNVLTKFSITCEKTDSRLNNIKTTTGVKLPKLVVKSFSGEPLEWVTFMETFEVAVHTNEHYRNREIHVFTGVFKRYSRTEHKRFPPNKREL